MLYPSEVRAAADQLIHLKTVNPGIFEAVLESIDNAVWYFGEPDQHAQAGAETPPTFPPKAAADSPIQQRRCAMNINHRGITYMVRTEADVILLCGLVSLTHEEHSLLALYRSAPIVSRAMVAIELIDYVRHSGNQQRALNSGADLQRFYRTSVRRLSRKRRARQH
jgi:hypothetical protein